MSRTGNLLKKESPCLSTGFFRKESIDESISDGAHFLPQSFAGQCLLDALLFTRFQVERVLFHILDDVFLLHLSFETTQRAFKRLTLVQNNFCQINSPPSDNERKSYLPYIPLSRL